jgi:hypothetical protein
VDEGEGGRGGRAGNRFERKSLGTFCRTEHESRDICKNVKVGIYSFYCTVCT